MENKQTGEEEKKHMAKQTSKGTCTFCHGDFSKSAITRHLETCEQRAITEAKAGNRQKPQKTRKFHHVVDASGNHGHHDPGNIGSVSQEYLAGVLWAFECF